jgi:hypothetical protein
MVKAGNGAWFDGRRPRRLQSLLQELQIIRNTRTALQYKSARACPRYASPAYCSMAA